MDEETAIVVKCISSNTSSRIIKQEIAELDAARKQISDSIRAFKGREFKPKIIWMLVTSRTRWSEKDLSLAKEKQIQIIREQELRYFMEIAKNIGKAARYQFHAEFLSGQKIPALSNAYVPASRFRLGGRTAYSFTISAKDLLRRAFVNHRDLRDPSGAPAYQRLVNPNRLKNIAAFLEKGGYFANSVLINFHQDMRFDITDREPEGGTRFGRLYLPDTYKSCWIIDGQHRIYGAAIVDESKAPTVPVVAFERLPTDAEARLFTTINREQRPVQKKLLEELDGELKWGSSDPKEALSAIAARALDILRSEVLGPFEDRIALPGMRGRQQPLTVPQLKPEIVKSQLIGRFSNRDGRLMPGALTGATDHETLANLCAYLSSYFDGIRGSNPDKWDSHSVPLCHNIAVSGLVRLAAELVDYMQQKDNTAAREISPDDLAEQTLILAEPLLEFFRTSTEAEFKEKFPIVFGSGGPRRFFLQAATIVNEALADFRPDGLIDHIAETSKDRTERADRSVKWIVDILHAHVVDALRASYGADFFEKGIRNKEIKIKAYSKRADTDPDGQTPLENYLDVIELKKIVDSPENWPIFKETLNIKLADQQNGLAKYTKWIEEFNEIRKIFAHPYNRKYSDDNLKVLETIESALTKNLRR